MTTKAYFTTSWDDGSIYDLKLAELLTRYNIKGTFYIPIRNRERQDNITSNEIREIATRFEIGGHTHSHVILTEVSDEIARQEIENGKKELENILGKEIEAFCFPRGKYRKEHIKMAKNSGFLFCRTTGFLRTKDLIKRREMLMHTTLQFYPHRRFNFFISAIKRKDVEGISLITKCFKNDFYNFLNTILEFIKINGGIFHLWGHSWELEKCHLWDKLEDFFRQLNGIPLIYKTNSELWNDCI